jgi:uncharacterized membrane protein YhaH (DUF805 family)
MNKIIECYIDAFRNYTNFEGKTGRREYWYFALVSFIISILLNIVDTQNANGTLSLMIQLFNLAVLIPGIAITTRRLHDVNKSGWFQLLNLIPIFGWIILTVLLAKKPVTVGNKY